MPKTIEKVIELNKIEREEEREEKRDLILEFSQYPTDLNELRILKKDGFRHTFSITTKVQGASAQTASNYTAMFFIARRRYEIVSVKERHDTAGDDAGAVTVMVKKVPDGTATGSGTNVLTAGINLKAGSDALQTGTLTATLADKRLDDGDCLALFASGVLTTVAGVSVVVELRAL